MNSESEIINWEQFDSITDNGAPDFMDIYQDFMDASPGLFESLKAAIQSQDSKAATSFAHQLKGSAANFGFVGVSEGAAVVETAARSGDFSRAITAFDQAWSAFGIGCEQVAAKYPS